MTSLSPREREVMQLVADGLTRAQVGAKLGIATRTVDWYISRVLRRTGAQSSASAVSWLTARGEIKAPELEDIAQNTV